MGTWTRRSMLQKAAVVAGAAQVQPAVLLSGSAPVLQAPVSGVRKYRLLMEQGKPTKLQFLQRGSSGWEEQQVIESPDAMLLLMHEVGRQLFVAHRTERRAGLPAGRVDAYDMHSHSGRLTLRASQPLALSARTPCAMVMNVAKNALIVAASNGVFSLLPLDLDANLQMIVAARKHLALMEGSTLSQLRESADLLLESAGLRKGCGDPVTVREGGAYRTFAE